MANKKITNKDRDQQLGYLTQTITRCFNIIGAYIDFKGDDVEFKKFLIEKEAEVKKEMEKKNDTENASESSGEGDSETVQAG
jgi:hypothetical protein